MPALKLIDQIAEAMEKIKQPAHIDEIALALVDLYPNLKVDLNDIPAKVSSILSKDIQRSGKHSRFSKPRNKKGGFRRGYYRLKNRVPDGPKVTEQPIVSTQYTGKAGEHAVISELLFFGFNASEMAVDDGIDIVASRDNSYFHIQVKTGNATVDDFATFTISRKTFEAKHSHQTFYVLVLRRAGKARHSNDFVILPSSELKRLLDSKVLTSGEKISLRISVNDKCRFILNADHDVTDHVNRFDAIV